MKDRLFEKIHKINFLAAEMDAVYHQAAFNLGVSDSIMRVLYTIHDNGEECLLTDVYKQSGINKQTVNSAIRKLEKENILFLEQYKGNLKKIVLTEKGKLYMKKTAVKLYETEISVFRNWAESDIDSHIRFMERYVNDFREQLKKLS